MKALKHLACLVKLIRTQLRCDHRRGAAGHGDSEAFLSELERAVLVAKRYTVSPICVIERHPRKGGVGLT